MPRDLDQAFDEFHRANPDLLVEIRKIAHHAKERGKTRLSMRLVFEVIRFRRTMKIIGDGEYELNNSYTPYYSRLVRAQDPELGSLFEIRVAKGSVRKAERRATVETEEDWTLCV